MERDISYTHPHTKTHLDGSADDKTQPAYATSARLGVPDHAAAVHFGNYELLVRTSMYVLSLALMRRSKRHIWEESRLHSVYVHLIQCAIC